MHRYRALPTALILAAVAVICTFGGQIIGAEQQPIRRTDLLKTYLPEMEGKEMQVWVADIPPGAATGPHFHPTRGLFMSSKVKLFWSLTERRRRHSQQVRRSWRLRWRHIRCGPNSCRLAAPPNSPAKPPALPERIELRHGDGASRACTHVGEAVLRLWEKSIEVIGSPWGTARAPQGDHNVKLNAALPCGTKR